MMSSTSSIASDDYIFEYRLDNDYNYYKYNKYTTSGFDKKNHSYSLGLSQPTFHAYEAYPSHITVMLNYKQETWAQYIKRQLGRLFGCFSIKIYSEVPDLPVVSDI